MTKLVKGVLGGFGATMFGGGDKSQKRAAQQAQEQARKQTEVARVNQIATANENAKRSSEAFGGAKKRRLSSLLLEPKAGKSTLG